MRERQENRRGEDLPGLHTLEGEAGVEAAPPKWSMLENHRTGAGYFATTAKPCMSLSITRSTGASTPTC